jgi:prevent-host-death family protein
MKTYTMSEARRKFAAVLEAAWREGAVRIYRRGGQSFVLQPEPATDSPLAVEGVQPAHPITREDILAAVAESRQRFDSGRG